MPVIPVRSHLTHHQFWSHTYDPILERNLSFVQLVLENFLCSETLKNTNLLIRVRRLMRVIPVRSHLTHQQFWSHTYDPMLERNLIIVQSVRIPVRSYLTVQQIWSHTYDPILERNLSFVQLVLENFLCAKTLKDTNLLIREKPYEKPYACDICSKSFNRSSSLKLHIRTHAGEKPYQCPKCTKAFSLLKNLKRHQLTHTSRKRYACITCSKSFSRPSYLMFHMRCHRTEEKLLHCPTCTCTNVSQQASQLIFHNVIHTENILPAIASQVQVPQN